MLTLLVAVPLLLPQGLCVCDFVQTCTACEEHCTTEPVKAACGCRKHQELAHEASHRAIANGHTCHQSVPSEKGDDHLPGCPARDGCAGKGDVGQPMTAVTVVASGLLQSLDTLTTSGLFAPSSQLAIADPPIYLTTLTLRI